MMSQITEINPSAVESLEMQTIQVTYSDSSQSEDVHVTNAQTVIEFTNLKQVPEQTLSGEPTIEEPSDSDITEKEQTLDPANVVKGANIRALTDAPSTTKDVNEVGNRYESLRPKRNKRLVDVPIITVNPQKGQKANSKGAHKRKTKKRKTQDEDLKKAKIVQENNLSNEQVDDDNLTVYVMEECNATTHGPILMKANPDAPGCTCLVHIKQEQVDNDDQCDVTIDNEPETVGCEYNLLTMDSTSLEKGGKNLRKLKRRNFRKLAADEDEAVPVVTETKKFKCSICPKAFNRKYRLEEHEMTHTGVKQFRCTLCEASFFKAFSLTLHHRKKHKGETFSCINCQEIFHDFRSYEKHNKTHVAHECKFCDKTFNSLNRLEKHEIIHTGEKPFKCE
ncbi:unnamed protein product, partial [Owenia fusiformis]